MAFGTYRHGACAVIRKPLGCWLVPRGKPLGNRVEGGCEASWALFGGFWDPLSGLLEGSWGL
eukprot:9065353-Pyramimonas_sp.AAC.1